LMEKTVRCKVITPLFSRGAQQATNGVYPFELRPQSVKGVLRFWFRAIAPLVIDIYKLDFNNLPQEKQKEWKKQFEKEKYKGLKYLENLIFGSQNMKAPFGLTIAIDNSQVDSRPLQWSERPSKKEFEAVSYPLYGVQDRNNKCEYLKPGARFSLEFFCKDEEIWEVILTLLKVVSTFSGFGAKTRKGLGEFEIVSPKSERDHASYKKFVQESADVVKGFVEKHNASAGTRFPKFLVEPTKFEGDIPEFPNFAASTLFKLEGLKADGFEKVMRELYYLRGNKETKEVIGRGWYLQLKRKLRTYKGDNVYELIDAMLGGKKELTLYPSIMGLPIQYQNLRVPRNKGASYELKNAVNKVKTIVSPSLKGLIEEDSDRKASPLFISIHKEDDIWYPLVLLMESQITYERQKKNDHLEPHLRKEHKVNKKEEEHYLDEINKNFQIKGFEDFEVLKKLIKDSGGIEDE